MKAKPLLDEKIESPAANRPIVFSRFLTNDTEGEDLLHLGRQNGVVIDHGENPIHRIPVLSRHDHGGRQPQRRCQDQAYQGE